MSDQPKTTELPAPDKHEIMLAELKVLMLQGIGQLDAKVAKGFQVLDTKVDRLEANLELQGGEIGIVKKELGVLFTWKDDVDSRLKNNSIRAASASQTDAEHKEQLAKLTSRTEEMIAAANKAQTEAIVKGVKEAVSSVVENTVSNAKKNPIIRRLGWAVVGLAFLAINYATMYLVNHGANQVAPTKQVQP